MFKVKLEGGPVNGNTFWITDMEREMAPFVFFNGWPKVDYTFDRYGDISEDFVVFYKAHPKPEPNPNPFRIVGESGPEVVNIQIPKRFYIE